MSTWSAIDTFTGEALSGPLRSAGATLSQVSVITSTWGEWKEDGGCVDAGRIDRQPPAAPKSKYPDS